MMKKQAPYEHGFMLSLLLLAIGGLIWLFMPFIPALFLALLIAIATFSQYNKLKSRLSANHAALAMTALVTTILILPLSYILLISGLEVSTQFKPSIPTLVWRKAAKYLSKPFQDCLFPSHLKPL
jgi:predicted PurR-regulated permease PerM